MVQVTLGTSCVELVPRIHTFEHLGVTSAPFAPLSDIPGPRVAAREQSPHAWD